THHAKAMPAARAVLVAHHAATLSIAVHGRIVTRIYAHCDETFVAIGEALRRRVRLEITGFDAAAQRYRGSQREHDNEVGLFSAFFSAPQRPCVKIANFQMDSSIPLPSAEGSLIRSLS